MEEQRRFKCLKNKLEAMNYHQHLSYDSMPLVECLLNDIINLNSSLSRVRLQKSDPEAIRELSERIDYLKREKQKLEDDIKKGAYSINDERESFALTMDDLKRENKLLNQRLGTLAKNFENREQVDKLYLDFNYLKQQLEKSEENVHKLTLDNMNLQDRLRMAEGQVIGLKKDLDVSTMTIKEITTENRATTEDFYGLKKMISGFESKISLFEDESNSLKIELQRANQVNRGLEQQIANLNKELNKSRNEVEIASSTRVRLSSQLDSVQRQLDVLELENSKLHSLREEEKGVILDLEEKSREYEENYKNLQEKLRVVQRESQNFCEAIREKGEELRNKDQVRLHLEAEIKDLRTTTVKYEDSLQENRKQREILDSLSQEIKHLKSENQNLFLSLNQKEDEIRHLRSSIDSARKENDSLKIKLEDENLRNATLGNSLKSSEETGKNTRFLLDESEKREKRLMKEAEQIQNMLYKSEEKSLTAQKNFDSAQMNVQYLQQEINKLQKALNEASELSNSKSLDLTRYENKLQSSLAEIEELRKKTFDLEQGKLRLADELKEHHKALMAEQGHSAKQSDQISHLRDVINSLEISRSDCIKKLENAHVNENDKEITINRLKDEVLQYKKQIGVYERNLAEKTQEKERTLTELETCKYELNRKSEEAGQILNNLKRSSFKYEKLKNKAKSLKDSEENFKRSWRDSEIEKSRLHEINLAINLQLEDSKKGCNKYQLQVQELSKEFPIIENRLKAAEEKIRQVSYEKDSLIVKNEELSKELRIKSEAFISVNRDKDDLVSKLRSLSEEHDNLLRSYDYLNLDFNKLSGKVSASENLSENLKKQESSYLLKIKLLEDELRNTIRACELTDYKRIEAEKTSEALIRDIQSSKSINREFDNSREEMIRKINSLENEKVFLEGKTRNAETEASNLRSQLEYEKKRIMEYESRIFSIKESINRKELGDEKSRNFNPDLVAELHRQIELYKVEGLRVEMSYMKLLDELNLTKHKLNKAEARIADLEVSLR